VPGLALAGAWTDTRWPATMEGAVRSGLAAARDVLSQPRPPRRTGNRETVSA
jgi:monoamine oxidase